MIAVRFVIVIVLLIVISALIISGGVDLQDLSRGKEITIKIKIKITKGQRALRIVVRGCRDTQACGTWEIREPTHPVL